jgi:DNA polymerase III subunit epsilon
MPTEENRRYAVIDVETTGLKAGQEKITEIAILIHNGMEVTDEFCSLVNPGMKIPYYITQLTGINDQMVAGAPMFYEIARQIVELTDNCIVVGHNVHFDMSFLKAEFRSLGYEYQRQTLDTVKLARKFIPGQASYSLGKLCKSLNINNSSRHRALGDAHATAELFGLILSFDQSPENLSLSGLPSALSKSLIDTLPEKHGVYYFYNSKGEIIYVGKSNNIRGRVLQHLSNNSSRKATEMKAGIADVSYTLTGSELIALLLESHEIKTHKPLYNRAQRRSLFNYGLYHFVDEQGYIRLKYGKTIEELSPDYAYSSQAEAREHLFFLTAQFELCQRLNGLYPGTGACFHVHIGQCRGACCGRETPESYNLRVNEALERYHFDHQSFYVFDKAPDENQVSVVKVVNSVYRGFGFVPADSIMSDPSAADDFIRHYPDNRDVRQIIRSYLKKNTVLRIWPVEHHE